MGLQFSSVLETIKKLFFHNPNACDNFVGDIIAENNNFNGWISDDMFTLSPKTVMPHEDGILDNSVDLSNGPEKILDLFLSSSEKPHSDSDSGEEDVIISHNE